MKRKLTRNILCQEAKMFAIRESKIGETALYGVTDGKAIGTFFERKFQRHLNRKYVYKIGNVAKEIDFPGLHVDMKVTSIRQPQSSCPYKSARQKIYGLGYSLLVFVYDKKDNSKSRTGKLRILHTIFVNKKRTGDFQTTRGLVQILENEGNTDNLVAFMKDRNLPLDDIEAYKIAEELLQKRPEPDYLTISNALQCSTVISLH